SERLCNAVNPLGLAFDLCKIADGGAVDDNLACTIAPLGAVLFITERRAESERGEDCVHLLVLGHGGLVLHAALVLAAGSTRFVREQTLAAIEAKAQELSSTAEIAAGVV